LLAVSLIENSNCYPLLSLNEPTGRPAAR